MMVSDSTSLVRNKHLLWDLRLSALWDWDSQTVTLSEYSYFKTGLLQVRSYWCWRQLSYAIKTQLKAPKAPLTTEYLYGIRAPIIDSFSAWKPSLCQRMPRNALERGHFVQKLLGGGFGFLELCHYGRRESLTLSRLVCHQTSLSYQISEWF